MVWFETDEREKLKTIGSSHPAYIEIDIRVRDGRYERIL